MKYDEILNPPPPLNINKMLLLLIALITLGSSTLSNAITLTLIGENKNPDFVFQRFNYEDPGATATSATTTGALTVTINTTNNVNTNTIGRYEIIYRATDANNASETATRTVYVVSEKKLDIDNNGQMRANQDGVMIWHYSLGASDKNFIKRAVGENAIINSATDLFAYVKYLSDNKFLDVDDDNKINHKDGAIILRYLLGVRGYNLTSSLNLTGTRTLAAAITNYFQNTLHPFIWRKEGDAQWFARKGHSSVIFNNKIWVLGGEVADNNIATPFESNDVWSSSDGVHWQQHPNAPWSKRQYHGAVVFNGKIWVLGGFDINSAVLNDVWVSNASGTGWTRATETTTAKWSVRRNHSSVVFNNKIWVFGGAFPTVTIINTNSGTISLDTEGFSNDVWSSENGVTWTRVATAAWSSGRSGHSTVVFKDRIWVLGGFGDSRLNEVWFSNASGTIWTKATPTMGPKWSRRSSHSSVVFNNKIWVLGGRFNSATRLNDVWSSADGVHWQQHENVHWSRRDDLSSIVFKNKMWVFGGEINNSRDVLRDIWSFGN